MTSRSLAAPAWALLALFVVYASAGTWTGAGPRIWAPLAVSWPDVAQNVLLYLPFGALGALTLRRRRQSASASVIEVGVIAVLLSLVVEVSQLYTVDRTASATDVLAAALGATAGGLAAEPTARLGDWLIDLVRPSGVLNAPGTPVLAVLLVAMVVVAWRPFDPTLDVSTLASRLRLLQRDPLQFESVAVAGHALLSTLLALAIAAAAYRLPVIEGRLTAGAAAIVIAIIVDAGQLAMGSQPIGLAGLAAQVAGAMTGAALLVASRVPK